MMLTNRPPSCSGDATQSASALGYRSFRPSVCSRELGKLGQGGGEDASLVRGLTMMVIQFKTVILAPKTVCYYTVQLILM